VKRIKHRAERIEFSAQHVFAYGQVCIDVMHKAASHQSPFMTNVPCLGASNCARRRKALFTMCVYFRAWPRRAVDDAAPSGEILAAAKANCSAISSRMLLEPAVVPRG
jgi:hypothetical protein